MFKKIKQHFLMKKQIKGKEQELIKMQKYYEILRYGATFIQFVREDLSKTQAEMDRHQRRRMQKTVLKGEFSEELINHYKNEIDRILIEINKRANKKVVYKNNRAGYVN